MSLDLTILAHVVIVVNALKQRDANKKLEGSLLYHPGIVIVGSKPFVNLHGMTTPQLRDRVSDHLLLTIKQPLI